MELDYNFFLFLTDRPTIARDGQIGIETKHLTGLALLWILSKMSAHNSNLSVFVSFVCQLARFSCIKQANG